MSRLPPLPDEALDAEQRRARDSIVSGPRGALRGPFPAWLRSPELAERAGRLGEFLRFGTSLPPRLSELAILVTARAWSAQYEWYAHAPLAAKGGLAEEVIEAIRTRRRPHFGQEDEAAVYDFCTELFETRRVGDAAYGRVVDLFGERGAVELLGLCGYYVMVGMTLNVAEVPLPDGVTPPLAD